MIYVRPLQSGEPIEIQEHLCREWASRNGYDISDVFRETVSGEYKRPALARLQAELETKATQAVLVLSTPYLTGNEERLKRLLALAIVYAGELIDVISGQRYDNDWLVGRVDVLQEQARQIAEQSRARLSKADY